MATQYIIAPKAEADVTTAGFKYDFEHNLWKDAEVKVESTWFADDGWSELPNQPTVELTATKGIKFHTPANTGNTRWQGQVRVETNIQVEASKTYDFSCNVNVPKAGAVTVKVQKLGKLKKRCPFSPCRKRSMKLAYLRILTIAEIDV